MQSYGKYTAQQQERLKIRNKDIVGQMRHYDEIVSHGKKQHAVKGFLADRQFEMAFKNEYFEKTDGQMWGLGDIDVVSLALKFKIPSAENDGEGMKTSFPVEACPPGYHLPDWERKRNKVFQPIS